MPKPDSTQAEALHDIESKERLTRHSVMDTHLVRYLEASAYLTFDSHRADRTADGNRDVKEQS